MFNDDLKIAWADSAHNKCLNKCGEMATPKKGAFTGYLTRLFARESLSHITADNFIANINFVRDEIDKDIKLNKASTGRVAEFISLTLNEVLSQSSSNSISRVMGGRVP